MKLPLKSLAFTLLLGLLHTAAFAGDLKVKITDELSSITVKHKGKNVTIMRNQDGNNTVNPIYAMTSRPCPPFCIQPIKLAPGIETIGEREILGYLQRVAQGDESVLVIDSRVQKWVKKGTIPGSINIPWVELNPDKGATYEDISEIFFDQFGVLDLGEGLVDFNYAKTLVMFCNGMWCGQSPANIKQLLRHGYPAHKIKWYRGGMQSWENLGFTVVQ